MPGAPVELNLRPGLFLLQRMSRNRVLLALQLERLPKLCRFALLAGNTFEVTTQLFI